MLKSTVFTTFNRISNFQTLSFFNSSIREAVNQGQFQKALFLYRQMKQNGLKPDNFTFPIVAKACARISDLRNCQLIHAHCKKSPYTSNLHVQTALIDMYVKCDKLDYAFSLFEEMPKRDVTSWNVLIMGFMQLGSVSRVLSLFDRMKSDMGIRPDSVTIIWLAQFASSSDEKDVKLLASVHNLGIKIGLVSDILVSNTLIAAYAKCQDRAMAEMVFEEIDWNCLTVVSWNSLISGFSYYPGDDGFKAVIVYRRMLKFSFIPDLSTILNLLGCFSKPEFLYQGKFIHCHGVHFGVTLDISILNTLISMYSKCGDIVSARNVFDSMVNRTCVSWTAMIGGYAEIGDLDNTIALFREMEAEDDDDEKPDSVTILHVISACGQVGDLETGRWIDKYALSKGFKNDVIICNALLDMYTKCGSINDAMELFSTMSEKTVVSWTTMISGFALHGKSQIALNHFDLMLNSGLKPNQVTFLAVLQACAHSGLLEKGQEYFDTMTKVYKINAGLDHYSCMADLFGRRGKLKESLDYIRNMPVEPDARVWASLLNASRNYRDINIGEYAAHRLFRLEPQAAAPYVEMANMYAYAGKWDDVCLVRTRMKSNQVKKCPGESIIYLDGKRCTFRVEDRFHPQESLIFEVLNVLALHLKDKDEPENNLIS